MPAKTTDRFRTLGVAAARAADSKKASDIVLRRLGDASPLADYFLVVSVDSRSQMEAVQEEIRLVLKSHGALISHRDGPDSALWRILDYGGLLIHIMNPETREFYSIDKLSHEGRKIPWEPRANGAKKAKQTQEA